MAKKEVLNLQTYKTLNKKNKYFEFIEECFKKKYGADVEKQMHHIIPKYVFRRGSIDDLAFLNSPENIIELSVEDHILAHKLLFEVYENPQDLGAVNLLSGLMQESRHIWRVLGAKATHIVQKAKSAGFWSSAFQKEMAGRSMARPDALETRSVGGSKGGKNINKNRIIKADEKFLFSFNEKEILCTINLGAKPLGW